MTSTVSPTFDARNRNSQRASPSQTGLSNVATNFVLGTAPTNQNQNAYSPQNSIVPKGSSFYVPTSDADHKISLLNNLSLDMGNLLNRTDISDCFLNVKGTYMAVHKCILAARSNAFAAVISGTYNRLDPNTREQIESTIHKDKLVISINKIDPEIMKQVVIFMYTAQCEIDESNAYDLLYAAGRYDIKDLKVHTGRFLADRINSSNILSLLKAAYKYDNKLIKQCCIEYFINNAKEIMAIHELWKQFAEDNQEIVAELLHWLVNRDLFFEEKPQWNTASRW